MKRNRPCVSLSLSWFLLLALAAQAGAVPMTTSWIMRSEVVAGQSVWGPGNLPVYNMSDKYIIDAWPIAGTGFEWSLMGDPGTVAGNVESWIKAKYDNHVVGTKPRIELSYAPIAGESNITASMGGSLSATPRFHANLFWPLPNIDWSFPISMLNANVVSSTNFAATLDRVQTATGKMDVLPVGLDAVLFSAHFELSFDQDITFKPMSVTGKITATHMGSGAVKDFDVLFDVDGVTFVKEMDLDQPGHWDIRLHDFTVADNHFHREFGTSATIGFKVPLLGVDISATRDNYFDFYISDFPLAFTPHAFDGDAATLDELGRFSIYVESIPEPTALCLLAAGFAALSHKRRPRRLAQP